MTEGQIVLGKFQPKDIALIKPEYHNFIGKECKFLVGGILSMDEKDPLYGQRVMTPLDPRAFPFRWLAQEDVEIIE